MKKSALRKFAQDEQQILYAEVFAPGMPDSQGDFMSAETIREMAYDFIPQDRSNIDLNHSQERAALVVESFIAREGDPTSSRAPG